MEGTSEHRDPTSVDAFMAWMDRFGDHVAGGRTAHAALIARAARLCDIHAILVKDQRDLAKLHSKLVRVRVLAISAVVLSLLGLCACESTTAAMHRASCSLARVRPG